MIRFGRTIRVFKTKWFSRFARKEDISDFALLEAIERLQSGVLDADLGGGLVKQRLARTGEGKSGGFRTIIAYKSGNSAFFIYGFAKNERDNIDAKDLKYLKSTAAELLGRLEREIEVLKNDNELMEILTL